MSCGRTLGVPLEWRWVFRGTSGVASRVSRTISRLKRGGGISLETVQWKRASSSIEGKISWFFSSCGGKLRVPLELRWGPRGPQGPDCVAAEKSGLFLRCEGHFEFPLDSLLVKRAVSRVPLKSVRATCQSSLFCKRLAVDPH